jgi:predicted nucleic acid-binding protein
VLVVDASAVVELLLHTALGGRVAERLGEEALHAPQLLDIEVVSVVNRLTNAGKLSGPEAAETLATYLALGVQRHDHEPLLGRIHELRGNFTAYDAAYVALAEGFGAPLLTCDAKLGASAAHRAAVDIVR